MQLIKGYFYDITTFKTHLNAFRVIFLRLEWDEYGSGFQLIVRNPQTRAEKPINAHTIIKISEVTQASNEDE